MFFLDEKSSKHNSSVYSNLFAFRGVGVVSSKKVLAALGLRKDLKVKHCLEISDKYYRFRNLNRDLEVNLNQVIDSKEGLEIGVEIRNIDRLIKNTSYRGNRHKFLLPVRGQRTHTNRSTQRKLGLTRLLLVKKHRNVKI